MTQVFDHPWLGGLFGDAEMAAIWSPEAQLEGMRAFEMAWSLALGAHGFATPAEGEAASQAIATMVFDLADLRDGTAADGVVVPRLVAQMQAAAGPASPAVHWGATSQDVIDSSLALGIKHSLDLLSERLIRLQGCLTDLATEQGESPLMGRTRMQAATPIHAEDRIAAWLLPLQNHLNRLAELRPRVQIVQIGGASGDRRALGDQGADIAAAVAQALALGNPSRAWHNMRDGLAEFAGLLSLITGTLGKMGQDIALMAQQGISEIALSGGGSSSAMPHKQNPVQAELLVTLARFNAGQLASMHQALVHEQERSGAAWSLEWMILPDMAQATARSLAVACQICQNIQRIGTAQG